MASNLKQKLFFWISKELKILWDGLCWIVNSTQISDQVKDLQCDFHKRCASPLQFILQSCISKHNPIIVYGDCNAMVVTLLEILMHCWYCSFNSLRPLQQSRVDGARSPRSQLFKMLFSSHRSSTNSSDTDTEIEDRGTFDVLSGGVWEGISILGQETKFCCILFCISNCGDSTENVCLNFDPNPIRYCKSKYESW